MRKYHVFLATKKDLSEIILLTHPGRNRSQCDFSPRYCTFTYGKEKPNV